MLNHGHDIGIPFESKGALKLSHGISWNRGMESVKNNWDDSSEDEPEKTHQVQVQVGGADVKKIVVPPAKPKVDPNVPIAQPDPLGPPKKPAPMVSYTYESDGQMGDDEDDFAYELEKVDKKMGIHFSVR